MTNEIDDEMRSTYAESKRWWRALLVLWVVSMVLAGATQFPLPPPLPAMAYAAGFLCAVGTFAVRWKAGALYQTAESLRRCRLLADGLGEEPHPADMARMRANASNRPSADPPPIGAYYTSTQTRGWLRVLHNVQESAFYTEKLAEVTAWWCVGGVVVVTLLALALLLVALNSEGPLAARSAVGNLVSGTLAAIIGGTLADLARAYFALAKSAEESFTTTRNLIDRKDLDLRDALRAVDAYNVALVGVPPIPGFVYRQQQARLDALWRAAAGASAPTGQPPS